MLKLLFLLTIEHVNIPEFVWGGAIASSKASADAQLPAFIRIISGWRNWVTEPLQRLAHIWLQTIAAFTPVSYVPDNKINIDFPPPVKEESEVQLQRIKQADVAGLITDATQLRLLELVEDPIAETEAANDEAQEKADQFEISLENDLNEEEEPDAEAEE